MPHLMHIASLDSSDVMTHANLGGCYEAKGRIQDAAREFHAVISLTDHKDLNAVERWSRASALLNLGFTYADSKNYAEALSNFQGANRSNPALVDQTIATVDHSLAATPAEEGYLRLSLLLRAKGKDIESSSILENAIKENPGYTHARALLNSWNTGLR